MVSTAQTERLQIQSIGPPAQLLRTLQRHNRQIYEALDSVRGLEGQNYLDPNQAAGLYGPRVIRDALQLGGPAQLSVQGLRGVLVQPQVAAAIRVSALPTAITDPLRQDGTLILFNGVVYVFNGVPAPGMWVAAAALGVTLEDSHANRLANFPATNYPTGVMFRETDRNVLYIVRLGVWQFLAGTMLAPFASRPVGLGVNDTGFLFFASDTLAISEWNGTVWIDFAGGGASNFGIRTITASAAVGASDFTVLSDCTAGAIVVTFPATPVNGRILNNEKIDLTANTLTLDGNGKLIAGFAQVLITDGGTNVETQYDGTQWRLL